MMNTRYLFYSKVIIFLITLLSGVYDSKAQPETGATNLSFTSVEGDRIRINWTRGSGQNRLVLLSENSNFNNEGIPFDATDYNASSIFGTGDQIGNNNFVVYKGTGAGVTVTGLDSNTTYYTRIYEYDGVNFATLYNTIDVLAGQISTLAKPTISATDLSSSTTGNSAILNWSRGNGSRNIVIVSDQAIPSNPVMYTSYSSNGNYSSAPNVANGKSVYVGVNSSIEVSNLEPATKYYVKIIEYNGASNPVYNYETVLVDSFFTATKPTVGSTNFTENTVTGNSISFRYLRGDGSRRLIVMSQNEPVDWKPIDGVDYNVGDDLGNNTNVIIKHVGTGGSTVLASTTGLTPSTTYHFAIFEYNGENTNTYYLQTDENILKGTITTLSPPTQQANNIIFSEITGNSVNVDFTAGNGDRRIVFVREGEPIVNFPINLKSYSSNANFNIAPSEGSSKIVYYSTGTGLTLTNLQPDKTYHFAVFEANGSGTGAVFNQNITGIGSVTTLGRPTIASDNLQIEVTNGNQMRLRFDKGNGVGRIIIAKEGSPVDTWPEDGVEYNASTSFGNGYELGEGNFVINNNASTSNSILITVSNIRPYSEYHFAVVEYNGNAENRLYMFPEDALLGDTLSMVAPDTQASNITFTDITPNSIRVNWENGSGNGRIVLIRPNDPVEDLPNDLQGVNSNNNYSNSPAIGNSKVVFSSTNNNLNNVEITNIPPGEYHFAIIEFNGSGSGSVYRSSDPLIASSQVGGPPEIPASNITFNNIQGNSFRLNFTAGDGISRFLIVKEGSPVDAWPEDGQDYNANANFGSGDELGEGNYITHNTTGSSNFTVNNLIPNTTYHIAIVEYNGSGTNSFYQSSDIVAIDSISTLSAPLVPTTNIFANNVIGNKMDITWTRGSGDGRLVIARLGAPTSVLPENLTNPNARNNFGQSVSNLGDGNYVVYAGTSDNFSLINLEPDTIYHLTFIEYNGTSGRVYQNDVITRTSFRTDQRPSQPASNLSFNNVEGDRVTLRFTTGNGTGSLIVMKKNALVNALPEDFESYASFNHNFTNGILLENDSYVVSKVSGTNINRIIQGLEPDTRYGVAVFEYDGSEGNERYFINEYLTGFVRTAAAPSIPAVGLNYNSLGTNSVNISWTNGNGDNRLVVIREYIPTEFIPDNLIRYNTTTAYNQQGNHRVVYRGTADNTTISNLTPGTTYYVSVYEYNGSSYPVYSTLKTTGFFTTLPNTGLIVGSFDVLTFCTLADDPNQVIEVPYIYSGLFGANNTLVVELLSSDQQMPSRVIASQNTSNATGFIPIVIPSDVSPGTDYRILIRSSNPVEVSPDNGADIRIQTTPIPQIVYDPNNVSSCGDPIPLAINEPNYNIQWFKDSQPIQFATNNVLQASESGQYQVRISAASGTCEASSDLLELAIYQQPNFELVLEDVYCEQNLPVELNETLPIGGTYIGNGITNDTFYPNLAGVGQHLIYYLYVDDVTQCRDSSFQSVQVLAFPAVNINLQIDTLYTDQDEIALNSATPQGGTYYLKYNNTETIVESIDPETLSPGVYELVYRYGDQNDVCSAADSIEFVVLNSTITVLAPALDNQCKGSTTDYQLPDGFPTGGLWSGDYVQNNRFDLSAAQEGVYLLYYTIEVAGDFYYDSTEIRVAMPYQVDTMVYLCQGESFIVGNTSINTTGEYEISLGMNQYGCDSTLNVRVELLETPVFINNMYTYTTNSVEIDISEWIQNYVLEAADKYTFSVQQSNPDVTIDNISDRVIRYTVPQGYLGNTAFDLEVCTCSNCNTFTVNLRFNISAPIDLVADRGSRYTIPFEEVYQASYGDFSFLKLDSLTKEAIAQVVNNGVNDFYIDYSTALNEVDIDSVYYELCDSSGLVCPINGYFRITFNVINEPNTGLPPIEVYNAISPNNDGKHDYLHIVNIEMYPNNRVVVFNRWGDIIFDQEAYDNNSVVWEGKGKNNNLVNDGSYFYTVYLDKEKGSKDGNLQKGYVYVNKGE